MLNIESMKSPFVKLKINPIILRMDKAIKILEAEGFQNYHGIYTSSKKYRHIGNVFCRADRLEIRSKSNGCIYSGKYPKNLIELLNDLNIPG